MSHTRSFRASALALAVLGTLAAGQAGATGFQLREQSVKNLGKSNAGSIVGKDASNVSLNPAAMTNLDKNTFQADITVIDLTADFTGSGRVLGSPALPLSGGNGGDPGDPTVVPNMAAVFPLKGALEGMTVGASIGAPFGLTNDGIEQGVGIYVDDVYYSRAASSTFDFLDVQQIEVLRGPQGTLYGKNTTAGAINIATRQPTFDFEGRAEVSIGNLGFKQAKAAISGPLSDNIAARLAVSSTSRRGTIFNVTSGNWINEQDNLGLRLQVLLRASDDLDISLAGDFNAQNPECCGTVYVRTGATQRPLNRQYAALAAAQGYSVVSTDPFQRLTDIDANLNAGNKTGGASLRIKWKLGAGELTAVTAWRFWDWKPENDRDFTGLPIVTKSQNPSQQNQFTQELRYNYSGDKIDFVVGAFAFHQKVKTQGTEQHGAASSAWTLNPTNALSKDPTVLDGLVAYNDQSLSNTSAALFGQLSWKVTDKLTIQPGVRLNYDKKKGYYSRTVFDGQGNPVLFGDKDPRKVQQLSVFAPQLVEPSFSDWNFSYDLTLSYKVAQDVLLYATYAKSFKSGGINLNGVPADAAGNPLLAAATVKPESVNHYEIGIKTQFWDRKATLNLSAFRTDISDYQALVTNGQLGVLRVHLTRLKDLPLDNPP